MKIAVYTHPGDPLSIKNYAGNIIRLLNAMGVQSEIFHDDTSMPAADLYWDPRAAGGAPPLKYMVASGKPYVVTLHGCAPSSVPAREYFPSYKKAFFGMIQNAYGYHKWKTLKHRPEGIITVSEYAKYEICRYLPLHQDQVFPIFHGVDHELFNTSGGGTTEHPYLLHISQYQPKKNFMRIVEAYSSLEVPGKPDLVAIVPGYENMIEAEGLVISNTPLSQQELAGYYKDAIGFVFPSIQESFGMPILEAMACGCPVITSNITACPEVSGDAALLVDPYSVDDIARAMKDIILDAELRKTLAAKGRERASGFTWQRCAEEHLRVFEQVMSNAK